MRLGGATVAFFAVLVGAGCVSPPRHEACTPLAHVRADDEATARWCAAEIEATLPRLRARLAPDQHGPVELWVQDGLPFFSEPWRRNVLGYAIRDQQHAFVERPGGDLDVWRLVLANELTHLVIDDRLVNASGFALHEALCENLAVDSLSDAAARTRAHADWWLGALYGVRRDVGLDVSLSVRVDPDFDSSVSWPLFHSDFRCEEDCPSLSIAALPLLDQEPRSDLANSAARGLASLMLHRVVSVHGWDDALRLLRARSAGAGVATWNARWFAFAGVSPDPDEWLAALLTDQDRSIVARRLIETAQLRTETHDVAATLLARVFLADRRHFPDDDLAAWLRRRAPRLELRGFELATPIEEHPGFLAALQRVWDDPPEGLAEFNVGSVMELVKAAASGS